MKSRGELQLVLGAIGPRSPTQRSFSRDVNGVRRKVIQLLAQKRPGLQGQINPRISRARPGLELPRMNHQHFMVASFKISHQLQQGGDDAIHLRQPSIGDQGNFHTLTCASVMGLGSLRF